MDQEISFNDQFEITKDALIKVLEPIETARGLANHWYIDRTSFEIEQRKIFACGWSCIGFVKDIPKPGDLHPVEFAGQPLLMVRGADATISVFHNVCQHRGRTLVEQPKSVKKSIVCPYHSWTYRLDGGLTGTPHIGGPGTHSCPGFEKDKIRLQTVRSTEWLGLVFVDLSGEAEGFDQYIAPVTEKWSEFMSVPLIHTGDDCSISFTLDCNWKLAIENYCEAYHLPWVHPDLNRYSPLERHHSIISGTYSGQRSECYDPQFPDGTPAFPNAPDLPAFWDKGAEYIALYPNVLLGFHRDHLIAVLVNPDGQTRTNEQFEIFYYDEAVRGTEFDTARATNRVLWETIFAEDRDAVESMQRGRYSSGFDGGKFSPTMDLPTHVFHTWIANALLHGRSVNAESSDQEA